MFLLKFQGNFKALRTNTLVKYFFTSTLQVNRNCLQQLKLGGERVHDVKRNVDQLIVPALYHIQLRVCREQQRRQQQPENTSQGPSLGEKTLEDIRNQWCNLLASQDLPPEAQEQVADILAAVLEPTPPRDIEARSRNCDHIPQQDDFALYDQHRNALVKLKEYFNKGEV